jgi:hypothetical protein
MAPFYTSIQFKSTHLLKHVLSQDQHLQTLTLLKGLFCDNDASGGAVIFFEIHDQLYF